MPKSAYRVPAEMRETSLLVKKSRFIACAKMVACRDDAKSFLLSKKQEYPDARHHCWAYVIGDPLSVSNVAVSDDGEPGGTAGKPILNVIQHKKIGDVMVLVTRYFGGVKLGTGGLTRAYSTVTETLLSQLKLRQRVFLVEASIFCDFSKEQMLRHWAGKNGAILSQTNYNYQVELTLQLPSENIPALKAFCLANALVLNLSQ